MKITRIAVARNGRRTLTVQLEPNETIFAIDDRMHYRLGGQVDEIMASNVIAEAVPTYWCSIEQKWVS